MSRTYRRKKGQQCSLIGVPGWIDETIEEYNSPWLKKFHWDRNKYTCHNKIKGYLRWTGNRSSFRQELREAMKGERVEDFYPHKSMNKFKQASWVL